VAGETRRAGSADPPRRSPESGAGVLGAPPVGATCLAEVQGQLYDLITAPEGVGKRLAELGRAPRDLETLVRSAGPLSPVERVDVYANMYFFRILEVLADEYAKLVTVMGDGPFHNLVTDYLLECRPAHPSLREVGARLPGYLARHPLGEDPPWLAALARLERARLELYDGPDAEPLTFDQIRVLPPEALPELRLVAVPCHAVLTTEPGISARWRALEDGGSPGDQPGPSKMPETILVWRQQLAVFHRVLDQDEVACLSLLGAGASFASVCELLAAESEPEAAARRAFELLARWLGDGLLAA
jgi:putative DNA-binding protein